MTKLHGIWFRSGFHIWGEGESVAGHAVSPPTNGDAEWHPCAIPVDALHAMVGDLSPDGLLASIAREGAIELWLPREHAAPVLSTRAHTLEELPTGGAHEPLQNYRVPTLRFKPADSIDLLTSLQKPLPETCGASVRYWWHLARYLVEMIRQRQFSPHVEDSIGQPTRAQWRLVVQSKESLAWLQRFADAMPHVCRAFDTSNERDRDSARLIESFLHTCADGLIRRSLVQDPFFDQIHERARDESTWDVRWLSSLLGKRSELDNGIEGKSDFVTHARNWIGKLDVEQTQVTARLCFELLDPAYEDADLQENKPETEETPWRIRYLLQLGDRSVGRRRTCPVALAPYDSNAAGGNHPRPDAGGRRVCPVRTIAEPRPPHRRVAQRIAGPCVYSRRRDPVGIAGIRRALTGVGAAIRTPDRFAFARRTERISR